MLDWKDIDLSLKYPLIATPACIIIYGNDRRCWQSLGPNIFWKKLSNSLRRTHFQLGEHQMKVLLGKLKFKFYNHSQPFTGRRRHQNNMLPMAVLGVTAFGVFAVPMGFQFLLILCGKAVLISKMALLLSSINGSRRVFYYFWKWKVRN